MVLIQLKNEHFLSLMKGLDHLRKDESLCDVNIVVCGRKIPAHKCILVSSSDYFKSLFLGPLRQNTSEVSLSSIAEDTENVEAVINFLYTGEIEVNDANLCDVINVSSFLLISNLRELCLDYMNSRVTLDTSIHYYLLANKYLEPRLESNLENTIRTRFHDYLRLQKSSLNVSPKELQMLMINCDIFRHCSQGEIIAFVFDWVTYGKTEELELLGMEILDSVKSLTDVGDEQNYKETLDIINSKLASVNNDTHFMEKMKSILAESLIGLKSTTKDDIKSSTAESNPEHLQEENLDPSGSENVLIAFVPKQRLLDYINGKSDCIQSNEAVQYICMYVPNQQLWFILGEDKYNGLFAKFQHKQSNRYLGVLMNDRVCFVFSGAAALYIFRLRCCTWYSINFNQLVSGIKDFIAPEDVGLVYSGNSLYLILRINVTMEMGKIKVYFRFYQLASHNQWVYKFRAPMDSGYIDTDEKYRLGKFAAVPVKDKEQILLACKADKLHIFIIDLNKSETEKIRMKYLTAPVVDNMKFDIWMLQYQHSIFFMEESIKEGGKVICKYKYKIKSGKTKKVTRSKIPLSPFESTHTSATASFGCQYGLRECDRECLWLFEGNHLYGSSLKAITLKGNGRLTERSLSPPPFSCATTLVAGQVNRELLNSLTPVRAYLQLPK